MIVAAETKRGPVTGAMAKCESEIETIIVRRIAFYYFCSTVASFYNVDGRGCCETRPKIGEISTLRDDW